MPSDQTGGSTTSRNDISMDSGATSPLSHKAPPSLEELELKPSFFLSLTLARNIWVASLFALWITGMTGIPLFVFAKNSPNHELFVVIIKVIPIVIFPIVLLFAVLLAKRACNKTTYKITDKRVEYSEGYLFIEDDSVSINEITSLSLKRGFLQKKYNLGSILLHSSMREIKLFDIPTPEKAYQWINQLLKNRE